MPINPVPPSTPLQNLLPASAAPYCHSQTCHQWLLPRLSRMMRPAMMPLGVRPASQPQQSPQSDDAACDYAAGCAACQPAATTAVLSTMRLELISRLRPHLGPKLLNTPLCGLHGNSKLGEATLHAAHAARKRRKVLFHAAHAV